MKRTFEFWGYKADKMKTLFSDIEESLQAYGFNKNQKSDMDYEPGEHPQKYKISIELLRSRKRSNKIFKKGDRINSLQELSQASLQQKSVTIKHGPPRMPAAFVIGMPGTLIHTYISKGMRIY